MKRRQFFKLGAAATAASAVGADNSAEAKSADASSFVEIPSLEGLVNRTDGKIEGSVFREDARTLPHNTESDVIVCGGGPAGIAAALASARNGSRTTLIELHGCLGGIWTAGMLGIILDSANKGGIMRELLEVLESRGGRTSPSKRLTYSPEIMKWVLEELCVAAGVNIQLFTRVVGAVCDKGRLTTVVTESKSGRQAWTAKAFVDCTGDGDLAAQAGCHFDVGIGDDCKCQPMSLMALLTGIDREEVAEFALMGKGSKEKLALLKLLKDSGVDPSYTRPSLFHLSDSLFALMANHEYGVSAFDPGQVTQATIRARAELHEIVGALRGVGGPWSKAEIVATGEQIGIREGRRIQGRYSLSAEDLQSGLKHPEAVCKATFPVDVHSLTKEEGQLRGYSAHGLKVRPYDIPLKALVAKDVDGLLMAGRCISGDFFAHASYRVTGNAVAMGEAAGKAASVAVSSKRLPHEIEIAEIRSSD